MGHSVGGIDWAKFLLQTAMKIFIILAIMALATARPGDVSFGGFTNSAIKSGRDSVVSFQGGQINNQNRNVDIRPGGHVDLTGSGIASVVREEIESGGGRDTENGKSVNE